MELEGLLIASNGRSGTIANGSNGSAEGIHLPLTAAQEVAPSMGLFSEHADTKEMVDLPDDIDELARLELAIGTRAAGVVVCGLDETDLELARFRALLDRLQQDWNPRPGIESALIYMLVQIITAWERWLERHLTQQSLEIHAVTAVERKAEERYYGRYWPERLDEAASLELSANMADRFNKMFMRTLRALRDLRRLSPQVVVQSAGQVNVAEQQVAINEMGEG